MNRKNTQIVALLITLVFLASCSQKNEIVNEEIIPASTETTTDVVNEINSAVAVETTVKNNVITRKQRYELPNGKGEDEVEFTVTMNGNTIENVSMKNLNIDTLTPPQQNFADAINDVIKGKTLKDIRDISAVGGSSLTTEAFKEALR